MEGILLIWIIFTGLIILTLWLIKQLDSRPASANNDFTLETAVATTTGNVALVPVATAKQSKQKRGRRIPRPHTPDDCVMCRHEAVDAGKDAGKDAEDISEAERIRRVIPYPLLKGNRGRPKTSNTEGYACLDPACDYRRITDSKIHALVADGSQKSIQGNVQQLVCQSCGGKFLVTRNTPMYRSKLSVDRTGEVVRALGEGLSLSACARVFKHSRTTIHRIANRSGEHFESLHDILLHGIHAIHVQLDELRTKLKGSAEATWVWVSLEVVSKLMLAIHVGQRTKDCAQTLVHKTVKTLATDCVPAYASDGLGHYHAALTSHYGAWDDQHQWQVDPRLNYAQVIKRYARRKLKYITRRILCGSLAAFTHTLMSAGLSGLITTFAVERVNLGLRTGVSALCRRSASIVCSECALTRRIEIRRAIYNFIQPHRSLRVELPMPVLCPSNHLYQRYIKRTPAMAAGLTKRILVMEDLLLRLALPRLSPVPISPPRLSSPVQ